MKHNLIFNVICKLPFRNFFNSVFKTSSKLVQTFFAPIAPIAYMKTDCVINKVKLSVTVAYMNP